MKIKYIVLISNDNTDLKIKIIGMLKLIKNDDGADNKVPLAVFFSFQL